MQHFYCPRCATQNHDDARYCRACGQDISFVSQALSGHPSVVESSEVEQAGEKKASRRRKREKKPPTLEKGIENIFVGVAFLIIFLSGLIFFRGGFMIWVWFIIPALACIGEGIGNLLRVKREEAALAAARVAQPAFQYTPRVNTLPPRNTSEIIQPPHSITEGTTRHLDQPFTAEAQRRRDAGVKG